MVHASRAQRLFAMQMPIAMRYLANTPVTWWDAEVGYQKPPAEDLSRLLQDLGLLQESWDAQYG